VTGRNLTLLQQVELGGWECPRCGDRMRPGVRSVHLIVEPPQVHRQFDCACGAWVAVRYTDAYEVGRFGRQWVEVSIIAQSDGAVTEENAVTTGSYGTPNIRGSGDAS